MSHHRLLPDFNVQRCIHLIIHSVCQSSVHALNCCTHTCMQGMRRRSHGRRQSRREQHTASGPAHQTQMLCQSPSKHPHPSSLSLTPVQSPGYRLLLAKGDPKRAEQVSIHCRLNRAMQASAAYLSPVAEHTHKCRPGALTTPDKQLTLSKSVATLETAQQNSIARACNAHFACTKQILALVCPRLARYNYQTCWSEAPVMSGCEYAADTRHAAEARSTGSGSRTGQISSRAQGNSWRILQQQEPGSPGSGVAQVLSVDEERLVDDRVNIQPQNGSSNIDSANGNPNKTRNSNGSAGKQGGGVSLFGSYKAPIRRD